MINSLLIIVLPLVLLTTLIPHVIEDNGTPWTIFDTALIFGLVSVVLLQGLYVLNRRGHYQLTVMLLTIGGFVIMSIHSLLSDPPHTQVLYFTLLSLVGSVVFSFRTTVILSLAAIGSIYVIGSLLPDLDADHFSEYMVVALVFEVFIVYITYNRNRLETDRHRQVRESETKLRMVMDQLPVAMWTLDKDLHVTSLLGKGFGIRDVSLTQATARIMAEIDSQHVAHNLHQVIHDGVPRQFDLSWDGIPYENYVEPFYDPNGQIIGCIGVSVDLRERRDAEKRQLELVAERERTATLSEIVQYASHDFKTPLSIMNTTLYLLKKDATPGKAGPRMEILELQVSHLNKILDNMLLIMNLNQGEEISMQRVSAASLVAKVYDETAVLAAQKSITLVTDMPTDYPTIPMNEPMLTRALVNLVDNAIHYTPEDGHITLRVYVTEKQLHIVLRDSGPGISRETLPRIFDWFYRGETARPMNRGNSGLGLPISKKIIELHSGIILVNSQPGSGTCFDVVFPLLN